MLLNQAAETLQENPAVVSKSIALLMDIEKKRSHFAKVLHHVDILHEAILLSILRK